ncbi:MAG: hexosaminidase [Acidimicrobiaceae bacterium]
MNLLPRPRHFELGDSLVANDIVSETIDASLPAEGYELRIGTDGVEVLGADDAGLFYARCTLEQLARLHDGRVPVGTIHDHPDLPVRGVMLDISRDKVPTMETISALVDRLASWKINQVQLYSEHTFAYENHPEAHGNASPFTADEIRALDAFCRDRHVELVPNQNCLGHMNRWVQHDRYRSLALRPDGFVDQWGIVRKAMTLDPSNPGSLALIRELLAELLPLFTSRRVHVGLDEAWELPPERLPEFLDWIATLRSLPELEGREMLIWGDMLAHDDALLGLLPAGVTVCEWGYDEWHPYDERGRALAKAGVPFWVAPGTSSWLSILGRFTNAVDTCRNAARAALDHGATGYLNTDWGDQGHLQQLPISDPGFSYGAAVSWCLDANADIDLTAALSAHAYDDPTGELAAALVLLGDAHLDVTPQFPNMSTIVLHLYFPQLTIGRGLTRGLTPEELAGLAQRLADARASVDRAAPRCADAALLVAELHWSIDIVELLTRDALARLDGDGTIESVPEATRLAFARELEELTDRYRQRWLARNRPGGLDDSVAWLENLHAAYTTGRPDPTWGGWRVSAPS